MNSQMPYQPSAQWAVDWFARLGCTPHKAGSDIGGKSDGNWKMFRGLDRKLRSAEFRGVTYWGLTSIPKELSGVEHGQYYGENMGIDYTTAPTTKHLVFHARQALIHDRLEEVLEAARPACELLRPQYGIGYRRKFKYMPSTFEMGNSGGSADPTEFNSGYWTLANLHEIYTLLRGVYPWNFFTSIQLNIKVGEIRLEDWIKSDSSRGQLSALTDRVTLWTIPDEAIPQIREELWKAGVILDHKRDFENKMDEYNVGSFAIIESMKTGKPLVHRPRGPGISEEEMLRTVLGAFGGPDSRVLKKEKSGKLRELSDDELPKAGKGKSKQN